MTDYEFHEFLCYGEFEDVMDIARFNTVVSEIINTTGVHAEVYDGCGSIKFVLTNGDRLYIDNCENGVVIYLGRRYRKLINKQLVKLLQACDHRLCESADLHVGLSGENEIMYIVRIPARDMTAQNIFDKLQWLSGKHDRLEKETI
ncbi:MAG: hypothetical protein AB8B64_02470 [Granulosicoccus sp.]